MLVTMKHIFKQFKTSHHEGIRAVIVGGFSSPVYNNLLIAGFVVNGINNVNTATIERRFDMRSSQVAWISSSYDLMGSILGIVMGYMALFFHNSHLMTVGAAAMALGSFVMCLPHLLVGTYDYYAGGIEDCDLYGESSL